MLTKILIADDHPVTRVGIRAILERNHSFEIIAEAIDGLDVVAKAHKQLPDIIIMDVSMPGLSGIEATKRILKEHPAIKILALSIHGGEKFVKEMLGAGAVGYLLKEEAPEELTKALEEITEGNVYLSSEVTKTALRSEIRDQEEGNFRVLKTKLQRPSVLKEYLVRNRIVRELEESISKPFSLVCAGAGYGKSIAVSQWLEETSCLHVWVSIDEEQNDLRMFLRYLVEAIDDRLPGYLEKTKDAISGITLPGLKDLSYTFFNDLSRIDTRLIVVLDDYHRISDYKVHNLLDSWILFPPAQIHLTIISRRDPPLNFKALRATGKMTEIRMNTLCFGRDEVEQFYNKTLSFNLSDESIKTLSEKTEGWIIPMTLISMLLKNKDDVDDTIAELDNNMDSISEYLVSEVLSIQPQYFKKPLLLSSLFNRFSPELLDDVILDDTDSKGLDFVDFIRRSNLFIYGLDRNNEWYRYHHLFQSLLYDQLIQEFSKNEIKNYHRKASQWFEKNNLLDEAMQHAVLTKDYDWASKIIVKNRLTLLGKNDYFQLERLLSRIPDEKVESNPELLLVELHIQWDHDNFIALGELEEKMNRVIHKMKEGSYVHNEFVFFVGFNSFFLRGDMSTALSCLDDAMARIPESSSGPRGTVEVIYMIFNQLGGKYDKVKNMFYSLIHEDMVPNRKNRLFLGYIVACMNQARFDEISMNYQKALSFSRKSNSKNALGFSLYYSASFFFRTGYLEKARTYFEEALEIRNFVHSRTAIDTMSSLILTYALSNEKDKARKTMNLLNNYISDLGGYFEIFGWSTRVRLNMINKNVDEVRAALKEYKEGVLDLVLWMDIPEITHARALLYEGSSENLKLAEEKLESLMQISRLYCNRIHLLEIRVLQAILFYRKGELEKAKEALLESLEISSNEGIVSFYIELGDSLASLLQHMPKEINDQEHVLKINARIEEFSTGNHLKFPGRTKTRSNVFTPKEMEVLKCISRGLNNKEIANKLFNSEETIKKHIYNMFQKLYVKNRLSLVKKAQDQGILE